jgi:Tol biopolymer transport system component/imidazolonepropionase-like amidohydrolase
MQRLAQVFCGLLLVAAAFFSTAAASVAGAPHPHGVISADLDGEDQPPTPAEPPSPSPEEKKAKPDLPPIEGEQPRPIEQKEAPTTGPAPAGKAGDGKAADAPGEKKDEKKEEKWDVNNPPGPSSEVTIDTDQGTWLSLDVSPDGKEIVFDLLGDLYTIPIGGGEARALTHDIAWQMQPRYSPDGKSIVFTSDQGGGDNIWVMDRDGKNPRAVTKESFRLLNSPSWSPDGEWIVARKHFTAQRSLGAGEMWLYHRTGGDGLQMTKKANDQKDTGEPVFSPDGRYLYYSQDITPGPTFEYNKDANGEIFDIQRLDRTTGETIPIVSGPGGAVRPTPSPDGKLLAFVRRVRAKSVLYLHDLRSGEEWPLYDGLDRDMQETWSIHGLYPVMAWTPDSRSLVFWSGGKIHRLEVASRQLADIPFHVHTTRKVTAALRFPVDVAPAKFDLKMLRWVEVSPKGDRVVFQTLGHLWIKNLPNGTPRRLTHQDDVWEYYPSFSRDGRQVVYTTWNDDSLGTVRIVSADGGGAGRVLTAEPGHYVEPVFSPDGKVVVFRKIAGGGLRAAAWSGDPGVYRVAADGAPGTAKKIPGVDDGLRPHFGASSDRVYLMEIGEKNVRQLVSLDLSGADKRTHVTSERATEFRVSPDGRWLAFRERYNAYITPLVVTGKAIEIGPKASALPLAKVSKDAGEYLGWSGDSKTLHWALGPELFSRDLKDAFAFVAGAPEKLPEAPAQGVRIGFAQTTDVPSGTVALVGGRIISMRGNEVIEDGAIVMTGNRIQAVGPRSEVKVPAGAKVIDTSGKTLIPGLVDVHWHGPFGSDGIIPQENWITYATLGFGVTTLHDPSNDNDTVFAAAELQRAGLITAPRIFSTGTILYGAAAPFTANIDSLDDARAHLRRQKAIGAISVKSYNQPRREQRQQVIAAARETGMMVVPEGGSLFEHNMTMVVDGHTGVEHSIPVANAYKDVAQLWSGTQVGYTPTLIVGYGGVWGENYWYAKTQVWADPRLLSFVPREVVDARARRPVLVPDEEWGHFYNSRTVTQLAHAGVHVQLGAHGQREGLGAHWEMWMLAQGGLSPHEVLRIGTLSGAEYLGMDKDLGSLEPGKLADIVVLDKNPLDDIRNTESISLVLQNGRVYDGKALDEIGNHPRKQKPFFWQRPAPAFPAPPSSAAHR